MTCSDLSSAIYRNRPKIIFVGGQKAGMISLLAAHTQVEIKSVVSYSKEVTDLADALNLKCYGAKGGRGAIYHDPDFLNDLDDCQMLLCVHGRDIIPKSVLDRIACVNVHPYLYIYKGADPVGRALKDRNYRGSVGVHQMTKELDSGPVLVEEFINVYGAQSVGEIYNKLYPAYVKAVVSTLKLMR